jgi:hypothetical protein
MSNRKTIYQSKNCQNELYIEGNKLGLQIDNHTKAEVDLIHLGQSVGNIIANVDYQQYLEKIKKNKNWVKFASILSKIKWK